MRIVLRDIRLGALANEDDACSAARNKLNSIIGNESYGELSVYRRSLDARHTNNISSVWSVSCYLDFDASEAILTKLNATVLDEGTLDIVYGEEKAEERPLVVGFGPAGMFCALLLAENGYRPIVIERGDDIEQRKKRVSNFFDNSVLDTESNVQFGAGGAGTFSDGKLVTRINDKKCRYVLETFYKYGAPKSVLTEAKPHIGTDNLGNIVESIRKRITECGGEVHFRTRFEGYRKCGKMLAVNTNIGEFTASSLVLAIGHSARDTYKILADDHLEMIPKPFSVGVRVEQLREEINRSIYGKLADKLGQAEYNFSYRKGEDAVYTFCMCPGGTVVAAASEENGVVVNGMSDYNRNGRNSNSALVVSVSPNDCGGGIFDGINFQRQLEHKAFVMGGRNYHAPVQTVGDYLNYKKSSSFSRITPTYMNGKGYEFCNLNELFPERINSFLKIGLTKFENKINGFAPADAVLSGVETRTSSPIRITRNDGLTSNSNENVYPCGEGAGYAGGITSASVDGIRVALKIMERYRPFN